MAAFCLTISACTPGSTPGDLELGPESTDLPKGPVTLRILDTAIDPGPNAEYDALIAAFEEAHPNVTIEREVLPFSSLLSTIKLRLSSDDAPDVAEGNPGAQTDGALVQGGLIRPLDDYASLYGWDEIWSQDTQATNLYSETGQFGSGDLYGISPRGEAVGVYYNRALLDDLGLEVPSTFAQFEDALDTARANGVTPLMLGEADGYTGDHVFMILANHFADPNETRAWVYGESGATFENAGTLEAATTLQKWSESGYFVDGFLGVKDADAQARFAQGEALFMTGISSIYAGLASGLGDDLGFMLLPPEKAGDDVYTTGSLSPGLHIAATSENPDVAAAWLNLLASPKGAQIISEQGGVPAVPLGADFEPDNPTFAAILDAWATLSSEGRLIPYLDAATSTMYDTLTPAVQNLMGGAITPEQLISAVQADWEESHQ
jgi:raffinose/stachyose/melibiose transport system substrate-binding protein